MLGWIIAGVVVVLAAIVILRLRSQMADGVQEREELRMSLHQTQEKLEQLRSDAVLGRMLGDLASSLASKQAVPDAVPEGLVSTLVDYHKRVHDYDAAVQYCLQPVELMPAADEDDLEKLMGHVTGARKRLFKARAALVEDDMLQRMPELLKKALQREPEDDLTAALVTVATAGRADHAIELGEVIASALVLTRARNTDGPILESDLQELPVLPPWPWLAPTLVNLLQLGMRGCATDKPAQFGARCADDHVAIEFSGLRTETQNQETIVATLFDIRQRLDEHGLHLTIGFEDQRLHGFTLAIPLPAGATSQQ